MDAIDDTSYQILLSNAWELRQTIARLTVSLQDPQYDKNDKEDIEVARKAAVGALRDLHGDLEKMGAQVPFYTYDLVPEHKKVGSSQLRKLREIPRQEVF